MPLAIVTGASSGIGEALVRKLYSEGWKVGLIARREEELSAICGDLGDNAAWATADVTRPDEAHSAIDQIQERLGPCDLLVANAGIGIPNKATNLKVDKLFTVMRVNFDGVVNCASHVIPGMLERGRGHLAVVSSVAGYRGLPGAGPYSASKSAISTLFESWRIDLAPHKVQVTRIHPGYVETPLTDRNRYSMPWIVTAEKAAAIIARGLAKGKRDIVFPWQMRWLMRVVRVLPNWLYDRIVGYAR